MTISISQAIELAIRHHQTGQLREAEMILTQVLQVQPQHPEALRWLGLVAQSTGHFPEALQLLDQALRINPRSIECLNDVGNILLALGRPADAATAYRQALEVAPGHPHLLNGLGNALRNQGRLKAALDAYRSALAQNPDFAEAHHNSGNILHECGDYEAALAAYRHALRLRPDYASAYANMANTLRVLGRTEEALEAAQTTLRLQPPTSVTENTLGALFHQMGRTDEAVAAFERALKLDPANASAGSNLASILGDIGRLDDALKCWNEMRTRHPHDAGLHGNFVYMLSYHPDYDGPTILREAQRWNEQHAAALSSTDERHPNSREPGRRLRIGYVSPGFHDHSLGRYLLPLLREHDHERYEVFCYSDVAAPDAITERFRGYADQWRDTTGVPNDQLAALIRADAIDVLVDTTLHMQGGRLLAFARKPAPVQVTFAGYPGTTGLSAMDYRLTDPFLDLPGETETEYTETSLRLPHTFWCYDPLERDVQVNASPAAGAPLTFGCLNHPRKINAAVLALWARVMNAVPESRLLIQANPGSLRERILQQLAAGGVQAPRIEFVPTCSRRDYLALYHRIDVALDTFPYNGHTTSLDALWMGVPVVTRTGHTVVSRAGLSQLSNLDLRELIANDDDEFVAIATRLANDLPRLAELRATLRARMEASPLMDAPQFCRDVEAAYRDAWQRWCHHE